MSFLFNENSSYMQNDFYWTILGVLKNKMRSSVCIMNAYVGLPNV